MVHSIPLISEPVSDLLDKIRHGSSPITLATLIINGVGDEHFFHDIARRQLADALSSTAILTQQALYTAVTTATGIPIPFVASILISSTTPHLVWSTGMAFLLPVVIG